MIATVFSVRTSSSIFSSVHDRRDWPADWIDTPLEILDRPTVTLPDHVPLEFRQSLINVLNGYVEVLSVRDNDIGLSNVIEHAILTGDHPPINCVPYRYSPAQRAAPFQWIKEFEANGWIEPAIGPWSFPVVIVPKKAGGIRICIDYRKLNNIKIKDVYPLPRIDVLLDVIGSAQFFSKFDVRHGFHHLLVREEDRPKMAFVLFEGTWQWVRCPMGICNALATFRRAMNMAFQNFVRKTRLAQSIINYCVIVYMDDILVYSSSYEGHVQHIEWTLHTLRDAGFKVALEKCDVDADQRASCVHRVPGAVDHPGLENGRGSPAPHVITRALAPYLQWTACLEEPGSDNTLPSRQEYLKPYGIIDRAFYPKEEPEEALEGDEEATEEEGDADEETSEEGSYSEYSEGEQSEEEEEVEEEEDEEEEVGSEWEDLPEEAARTGTEAENPEAARRREEIAAGKSQLEIASEASLCINDDTTRDPEPPEPEDGGSATAAPSASRRRRSRSPSPSPSTPTRPPIRPRTDGGNRPSSPVIIPPSP
ncbi:hypothetical protein CBR_g4205 [Chara braunii]|uniref:Reverse transcriptase domain-containing protein n=1 Tax=Chara braunii TaxID=69332 RepID=A0A388KHI8_CHABU|nr:hypothetical protein CBR_g4205 [Chara braunii]|eukprot:GBG69512.1 hypothetical protein CBR_g4205 [Chara braunii]